MAAAPGRRVSAARPDTAAREPVYERWKPMDVLLISANTEKINMPTLPMGLGMVAAAATRAGHRVTFLDLMGDASPDDALARAIASCTPEVIGISIRNIDDQASDQPQFLLRTARSVVTRCKSLSDAPIVLGGAGYSLFPQAALDYLGADFGIQGEGEAAFAMLLDRLAEGTDPTGVPGLFRRGAASRMARHFLDRLDDWPYPEPSLFDVSRFADPNWYLPIQTRRGCPLHCSYCSTAAIEGSRIRKRSVDAVIGELARWRNAGFSRIFFVDNTFNLPPTYARDLCGAMIEKDLNLSWRCILYPGRVKQPLVDAMARAGCTDVSLGFESGHHQVLQGMGKRFRPSDIRRTSRMLKDAGIRRMGFLLLGGPDETRASVAESLEFVAGLDLEAVKVTIGIRIYPNTRLAAIAAAEGIIDPSDDLLRPRFYIRPGLEDWLRETVDEWMTRRPNWVA